MGYVTYSFLKKANIMVLAISYILNEVRDVDIVRV